MSRRKVRDHILSQRIDDGFARLLVRLTLQSTDQGANNAVGLVVSKPVVAPSREWISALVSGQRPNFVLRIS